MSQSVRAKPVKKATALVSAMDDRANRAVDRGRPIGSGSLADKKMRRIRRRSAPEVAAQGETDVCRKRQLASPAGFSRRHRHRVVLPNRGLRPEAAPPQWPASPDRSGKERDGGAARRACPDLRSKAARNVRRCASFSTSGRTCRPKSATHGTACTKHRGTSAPQMHEAQKLSQAGERAIDTFRVQHATLPGGVATQIFWPHSIPSQRSTLKLPRQILTNDAQRRFARAGRARPDGHAGSSRSGRSQGCQRKRERGLSNRPRNLSH